MPNVPLPGFSPPAWTNQDMVLFHGTTLAAAKAILGGHPINPALGKPRSDFGQGFYATTLLQQARTWAWARTQRSSVAAAVIRFQVGRDALTTLETLTFVRADYGADDFWSFVLHCRRGIPHHGRIGPQPGYDLVVGPVSAAWQQRLALQGCDQFGFHTLAATRILDAAPKTLLHVP